jgi:hypothetical protein
MSMGTSIHGDRLQNAFHIGLREIIADEQQATVMRLGDFISETVAEGAPARKGKVASQDARARRSAALQRTNEPK